MQFALFLHDDIVIMYHRAHYIRVRHNSNNVALYIKNSAMTDF